MSLSAENLNFSNVWGGGPFKHILQNVSTSTTKEVGLSQFSPFIFNSKKCYLGLCGDDYPAEDACGHGEQGPPLAETKLFLLFYFCEFNKSSITFEWILLISDKGKWKRFCHICKYKYMGHNTSYPDLPPSPPQCGKLNFYHFYCPLNLPVNRK